MSRYEVELCSINRIDESKDIIFKTLVEADSDADAIEKAKAEQKVKHPEIRPADTWAWSPCKMGE